MTRALLAALVLVLSVAGPSASVSVTMRNDDGTAEAFVAVDAPDDLARKSFEIAPAQFATILSAELHVVAKAMHCSGPPGLHKITMTGATLALFDPCARFGKEEATEATFAIAGTHFRPGENRITIMDTAWTVGNRAAAYAIDADHDHGQSLAYSDYSPDIPGELMWWLVLEQAAHIVDGVVRDADATQEDVVDFDYVDDRAEKILLVPAAVLDGGRTAHLSIYAAAKNCGPDDLPGTQSLAVDGVPVVTFDPCAHWRANPSWAALPVPMALLHEGAMTFSLDDSGVSWEDAGLLLGVDTDHDFGRSTMLGSHAPTGGELMWSLKISKASA